MATTTQILSNPEEYLGADATAGDAALFCSAAYWLREESPDLTDEEACEQVWGNGDWLPRATQIVERHA